MASSWRFLCQHMMKLTYAILRPRSCSGHRAKTVVTLRFDVVTFSLLQSLSIRTSWNLASFLGGFINLRCERALKLAVWVTGWLGTWLVRWVASMNESSGDGGATGCRLYIWTTKACCTAGRSSWRVLRELFNAPQTTVWIM